MSSGFGVDTVDGVTERPGLIYNKQGCHCGRGEVQGFPGSLTELVCAPYRDVAALGGEFKKQVSGECCSNDIFSEIAACVGARLCCLV